MKRFFFALPLLLAVSLSAQENNDRWLVYYSDKAPIEAFEPYSLIVLDSDYHPSLKALKERNKTLLGYISLGEVEQARAWYEDVKAEGILMGENKNWPGSYYVDVRDPRWAKRVIEKLIPQILHKGFDGLFFDTLDNPGNLEDEDPRKYAGMKDGAAKLVQAIRLHYPDIPLMMNRGYAILPKVVNDITYELAEDAFTTYDFKNKTYLMQPKEAVEEQINLLTEAKTTNPELGLYSLDYWYPEQKEKIEEIYQRARESDLNPYVGTIDLDVIVPEPK